jgi:hypothetical protein
LKSIIWGKELIYYQLEENNCIITIYYETLDDEMNIPNEKYRIEIKNNLFSEIIKTEWLNSRPSPSFEWINDDLFRINFGSTFAPSSYSYFYSKSLNKFSNSFSLATGVVDMDYHLVLCAGFEFTIYNIFNSEIYLIINTPRDSIGGLLWFSIGKNTCFKNKNLLLEYYDNNWNLQTQIFNLEETLLYE